MYTQHQASTQRSGRRLMRRSVVASAAAAAAVIVFGTTSALAFEPPGEGKKNFGCVDGENSPIFGHPGANGLGHAAFRVNELTGNPMSTAWNAVAKADPIKLGSC